MKNKKSIVDNKKTIKLNSQYIKKTLKKNKNLGNNVCTMANLMPSVPMEEVHKLSWKERCKNNIKKFFGWIKIFGLGLLIGFIVSTMLFYNHQYSLNFHINDIHKTDTIFITKYITDTVVTDDAVKVWLYSKCGSRYDSMMASAFIYGDSIVSTPSRIMAIAYGETRLGKIILNKSSKAYGLMQIIPSTARYLDINYDSLQYDDYAIYAGAYVLRKHYEYAKNNLHKGIRDYSGGGYTLQYLDNIYNVELFKYIVLVEKMQDNWLYQIIKPDVET